MNRGKLLTFLFLMLVIPTILLLFAYFYMGLDRDTLVASAIGAFLGVNYGLAIKLLTEGSKNE